MLVTYLVGQYWFIFVQIMCLLDPDFNHDIGAEYVTDRLVFYGGFYSFLQNENWDFTY